MPFVSKTLQLSFCACVRNIPKIVMFVIERMKLVSFSLFLDASPPPHRPKMPFGQMNVIIYSCFPKFLQIAIIVIIIYIPYTCLSVCNKLVLCLKCDLFLLLHARHI